MRKTPIGQRSSRGEGAPGRRDARGEAKGGLAALSRVKPKGGDRWKARAEQDAALRAERKARHEQRARGERPGQDAEAEGHSQKKRRPMPGKGPGGKGGPQGPTVSEPMRIAKAMARAGLCSRREAERWIAEGRVNINGQVLKTPAFEVKPKDRVLVDGKPLPIAEPAQLWRYYKPKGLVTSHNDPQGRPTVFDNLPDGLPRVVSIGRLDFNTEGLILLTNDGELARHLELPATGWLRRYRVRAKGRVTQVDLDKLKEGVELEGVKYGPVEAHIDTMQGANMWITVGIREGKNREVRRVLSSLGLEVNRLIRISFGPFQLSELKPGEAEYVKRRVLADQLGPKLAEEFGLLEDRDPSTVKTGSKPGAKTGTTKTGPNKTGPNKTGTKMGSKAGGKVLGTSGGKSNEKTGGARDMPRASDVAPEDFKPWQKRPARDEDDA